MIRLIDTLITPINTDPTSAFDMLRFLKRRIRDYPAAERAYRLRGAYASAAGPELPILGESVIAQLLQIAGGSDLEQRHFLEAVDVVRHRLVESGNSSVDAEYMMRLVDELITPIGDPTTEKIVLRYLERIHTYPPGNRAYRIRSAYAFGAPGVRLPEEAVVDRLLQIVGGSDREQQLFVKTVNAVQCLRKSMTQLVDDLTIPIHIAAFRNSMLWYLEGILWTHPSNPNLEDAIQRQYIACGLPEECIPEAAVIKRFRKIVDGSVVQKNAFQEALVRVQIRSTSLTMGHDQTISNPANTIYIT